MPSWLEMTYSRIVFRAAITPAYLFGTPFDKSWLLGAVVFTTLLFYSQFLLMHWVACSGLDSPASNHLTQKLKKYRGNGFAHHFALASISCYFSIYHYRLSSMEMVRVGVSVREADFCISYSYYYIYLNWSIIQSSTILTDKQTWIRARQKHQKNPFTPPNQVFLLAFEEPNLGLKVSNSKHHGFPMLC